MAKGGVVPSASHLTENVPGPARKDRFRLIDAHMKRMKCLWPSECGIRKRKATRSQSTIKHNENGGKLKKRNEKREEKRRCIKSAAPGLPAWSPTAVLPRLEPQRENG